MEVAAHLLLKLALNKVLLMILTLLGFGTTHKKVEFQRSVMEQDRNGGTQAQTTIVWALRRNILMMKLYNIGK